MSYSDEYQSLRTELLHEYERQVNLAGLAFTATGIIVAASFAAQHPVVFLFPLPILALLLHQLVNSQRTIFTISVYIRVFIETINEANQHWETTISDLREAQRENGHFRPLTEVTLARFTRDIGIACIFLAFGSILLTVGPLFQSIGPAPIDWTKLTYSLVEPALTFLAALVGLVLWIVLYGHISNDIQFVNSGGFEKEKRTELKPIYERLTGKKLS